MSSATSPSMARTRSAGSLRAPPPPPPPMPSPADALQPVVSQQSSRSLASSWSQPSDPVVLDTINALVQVDTELAVSQNEILLKDVLATLQAEEEQLRKDVEDSANAELYKTFVQRQADLEREETRLLQQIHDTERLLSRERAALCDPPAKILPSDPERVKLYVSWKQTLLTTEDLLRSSRQRKHRLLLELQERQESQIAMLELERRAAAESLRELLGGERERLTRSSNELAVLQQAIADTKAGIEEFQSKFRQLQVGVMLDRLAQSAELANLTKRRNELHADLEEFNRAVEAARVAVVDEASREWERKLEEAKAEGEARLATEHDMVQEKLARVRAALIQQYEEGLKPHLQQAEEEHLQDLQRIAELERLLQSKEDDLAAAHGNARLALVTADEAAGGGGGGGGSQGPTEAQIEQFRDLRATLVTLFDQLQVPAEEVAEFWSTCDLEAPYTEESFELYKRTFETLQG